MPGSKEDKIEIKIIIANLGPKPKIGAFLYSLALR
jgi:hypothetical protein